jgi:hypothetical protein
MNQATDDVLEANSRGEELAELIRTASQLRIDLDGSCRLAQLTERDAVDATLIGSAASPGTLGERVPRDNATGPPAGIPLG